ncbi:hypothetical protein FISHEDRAFT_74251 [Fistulina hepatica ATCC 64428]|uniref:F-box domain-containing protein n=1 Tax=Fistulina hepatica ATCC 64428 TaxID=1128425 RepID=A0A0D7AAS3_9AGAR|nr:hypothetical protein FISHEDRAFT_74251 [Fistulina hepatica ATCC 64428]
MYCSPSPLDIPDLAFEIVAFLSTQDDAETSLRNCALTSKSLLPICQSFLFRSVRLTETRTYERFLALFGVAGHVTEYVRELHVLILLDWSTGHALPHVETFLRCGLPRLACLSSLTLASPPSSFSWARLPEMARRSVSAALQFPLLQRLLLQGIHDFPLASIEKSTHLHELRLRDTHFVGGGARSKSRAPASVQRSKSRAPTRSKSRVARSKSRAPTRSKSRARSRNPRSQLHVLAVDVASPRHGKRVHAVQMLARMCDVSGVRHLVVRMRSHDHSPIARLLDACVGIEVLELIVIGAAQGTSGRSAARWYGDRLNLRPCTQMQTLIVTGMRVRDGMNPFTWLADLVGSVPRENTLRRIVFADFHVQAVTLPDFWVLGLNALDVLFASPRLSSLGEIEVMLKDTWVQTDMSATDMFAHAMPYTHDRLKITAC